MALGMGAEIFVLGRHVAAKIGEGSVAARADARRGASFEDGDLLFESGGDGARLGDIVVFLGKALLEQIALAPHRIQLHSLGLSEGKSVPIRAIEPISCFAASSEKSAGRSEFDAAICAMGNLKFA
jgi:hypothetical protein